MIQLVTIKVSYEESAIEAKLTTLLLVLIATTASVTEF